MPNPSFDRILRPGDTLYRKMNPGQWDATTLKVGPEAFEDEHDDLSLYVARFIGRNRVLEKFTEYAGLRRRYFGSPAPVTVEDLYRIGFGICRLPYERVISLGLQFKITRGCEISRKGHVDVINGQIFSVELSRAAIALTREEFFPRGHH